MEAKLTRNFTLWDTINLFIVSIIGSGIFISVKAAADNSPNSGITILFFLILGLFNLAGSLSFAELATCFPENGGDILYLKILLFKKWKINHLACFIKTFSELLIVRPGACGLIAMVSSKYFLAAIFSQ